MNIVELKHTTAAPWRNRGGVTRELLAWPGAADWQVRVSVADIDRSGPFSRFAEVDRCFAVIGGAGVRLSAAGATRELRPGDAPWCFDGALAPQCELLGGPTTDLNLMVQRSFGRAAMTALTATPTIDAALRWRALYAADSLCLSIDGEALVVPAGALVWSAAPGPQRWSVTAPAPTRAWWLAAAA